MGTTHAWLVRSGAFFVVAGLLLMGPLSISAAGKDEPPNPIWAWTKAFPKPSWWTWGDDYEPSKPVRGGYYRSAAPRYIGLMNPNHWPVNDWVAMTYFYERLIYADGSYKPAVPWLAVSWAYLDPKTVVMKLRKGVTFHDGSPFNAEALKYHMDWIMDPASGAWSRAWLEPVQSVEAVDEHTIKWHFKGPWAGFLGIMQNVPGMPISAKALREDPKSVDTHPVGTGAYMLEDASPGNYLKVKRNPDWWFGKSIDRPDMPYFDGIIINVIPDPSVRLANLRAGTIDGMPVDPSQYELVKEDPNLKVYAMPQNHVFGMAFNHEEGPCKDIRVRKAVSHAIDRKALIQGAMFGLGRLASCMYPGDHWTHNPDLEPVRYDPELSKKLLAEAGYKDGLTLEGMFGNLPLSATLAEAIKGMLADVGIDWKVDLLDPAAISDRMKNIEYDLMGLLWTWIWDPDLMATGLYHPDGGFNYGRSNNEQAISLIAAGRKEVELDKRQKIYFELEKVLYDNYEDVWISWSMSVNAYRKNVMGWDNEKYLKGREGFWFSHPLWFKEGKP